VAVVLLVAVMGLQLLLHRALTELL
jgi:hypothetical protein